MDTRLLWSYHTRSDRARALKWLAVIGVSVALVGASLACSAGSSPADGGVAATEAPVEAATQPAEVTGASPLETLDPCTVVTQDDAAAFFGAPSVAGMPGMPGEGDTTAFCIYATADNVNHLSFNLSYHAEGAVNADDYALKSLNQDVPGLGEGAFYDPAASILTIAKGPWIVKLSGNIQGVDSPLEKLSALAQTALGRLP